MRKQHLVVILVISCLVVGSLVLAHLSKPKVSPTGEALDQTGEETPQPGEEDYAERLQTVEKLLREGYLDEAIKELELITREKPRLVEAQLMLAELYIQLGEYEKAKQVYEEAGFEVPPFLKGKVEAPLPLDTNLLLESAMRLHEAGKNDEALQRVERVLELEPESLEAMHLKVTILESMGRKEEARRIWESFMENMVKKMEERKKKGEE